LEQALQQHRTTLQPRMEFGLRCLARRRVVRHRPTAPRAAGMQQARAELGTLSLTGEQAAALAVLEHRAALTLPY
jgi:hypothetical protein